MYIRFAQLGRDPRCRVAPGIFYAWHSLPPYDPADWRHQEIDRLSCWFGTHLGFPERVARSVGRDPARPGVCWFRDAADRHISEARYLAWLFGDLGVPIRELRSAHPGPVIWSDDHQIVAIPDRRHASVHVVP